MNVSTGGRPEDRARANIDRLLTAAGWLIQNRDSIDIEAGRGIAIREFPLATGHGFADYLLYIDGYAAGVVEAKKTGVPLIGVEIQTAKYSVGLPQNLPAPRRPLPFCYESTGVETRFTNLLEPDARSRPVFGFTAMAHLGAERFAAMPFPLRPKSSQQAIVDYLDASLSSIAHLAGEIDTASTRADRLRQTILKKAFEGALVPQDPNDEPASILLERIRSTRAHAAARRAPRKPEVHD